MRLRRWLPLYLWLSNIMGYSRFYDQLSAVILSFLIRFKNICKDAVKERVFNKNILVVGAGPSLISDIKRILKAGLFDRFVVISADGATKALIKHGVFPDVVVTDLDGDIKSILLAHMKKAIIIIHAHGDNIVRLLRYVRLFRHVLGTTQVFPLDNVYNFGGFTDGDRCIFMAEDLGAKNIFLIGMDFGHEIGEYSKPDEFNRIIKIKKLLIGKILLEVLAKETRLKIYNMTGGGVNIKGVKRIGIAELKRILGDDMSS